MQLEEKLALAREKQRVLVQRHVHAQRKRRAQTTIRRADTANAVAKFESFEHRIERLEAEADLVNAGRKPSLEDEFSKMVSDEEIEKELEALKSGTAESEDESEKSDA
jgi:phage shock protein A